MIVRFRIKTILVVIALLAAYMAFARPFLRDPFSFGPVVLVGVTILHEADFEHTRPAQRPTAEDRSPD